MKLSVRLAADRFPSRVGDLARDAERAGFDACHTTDHPSPPARWVDSGGHHAHDPFVILASADAATSTIGLLTCAVVLPYRNPLLLARSVASLDAVSGGRAIVGTATGYLKGEFYALGADFAGREARCDEAIAAMRAAWSADTFDFEGDGFSARGCTIQPRPDRRIPIWVGGNSRASMRRAAIHGDGWMPFLASPPMAEATRTAAVDSLADLRERITFARQYAESEARSGDFDIAVVDASIDSASEPAKTIDTIGRLTELGVTWLIVSLADSDSYDAVADATARFGDAIITST